MRPCKGGHFLVRALVIMLSLRCTGVRGQNLPGYSIDVERDVSVQEGQCVTIPCTFTADYQTTFTNSRGYWLIDSKTAVARSKVLPRKFGEPRENFHFIGNPDEGNCTLTITDASKKDSGSYYFRFEGPQNYGYTDKPITVVVANPPKKAEITISSSTGGFQYLDETVIIRDNEPLTMNCSAEANPPATVTWLKGTGKDQLWSTITTDNSLEETYTCVAYNEHGRAEKTLKTIFEDGPWKPEIGIITSKETFQSSQTSPPIITVNKGDTITCSVNSNRPVNVIWQRGDNVLGKSTSRELSINVTQQGSYRCVAWSRAEMASKSIKVNFPDTDLPADIHEGTAISCMDSKVIVGIVVGNIVMLLLLAVGIFCLLKRHMRKTPGTKPKDVQEESVYQDLIGQKEDAYEKITMKTLTDNNDQIRRK